LEEHQPLNDKMADGRPGPDLVKFELKHGCDIKMYGRVPINLTKA